MQTEYISIYTEIYISTLLYYLYYLFFSNWKRLKSGESNVGQDNIHHCVMSPSPGWISSSALGPWLTIGWRDKCPFDTVYYVTITSLYEAGGVLNRLTPLLSSLMGLFCSGWPRIFVSWTECDPPHSAWAAPWKYSGGQYRHLTETSLSPDPWLRRPWWAAPGLCNCNCAELKNTYFECLRLEGCVKPVHNDPTVHPRLEQRL